MCTCVCVCIYIYIYTYLCVWRLDMCIYIYIHIYTYIIYYIYIVIYRTVISCAYLCKHLPGIFISSAVFLYGQWSTHKWSKYQKAMSTVRPLPLITGVLPAPPWFCQVDDHLFISSSVFWSISIHIIYIIHIIPTSTHGWQISVIPGFPAIFCRISRRCRIWE